LREGGGGERELELLLLGELEGDAAVLGGVGGAEEAGVVAVGFISLSISLTRPPTLPPMPGKVHFQFADGAMKGKAFVFDEHDTFVSLR